MMTGIRVVLDYVILKKNVIFYEDIRKGIITLPRFLTITWFVVRDCQIIKKWVNHFPDENSHLKAEQTTPQFQTTALFVHSYLLNLILVVKCKNNSLSIDNNAINAFVVSTNVRSP